MIPSTTTGRASARPNAWADVSLRWHRFERRRPEWWLWLVALGAWAALAVMAAAHGTGGSAVMDHNGPMDHGTMAPHAMPVPPESAVPSGGPGAASVGWWAVMVLAMMLPMVLLSARWIALRCRWRQRAVAMGCFAIAYVAGWTAVGAVALAVLRPLQGNLVAAAGALVVAAAWHRSRHRRKAMQRCGSMLVPRISPGALVVDCGRAGLVTAQRCIVTCWAAMLPMAFVHAPALMVGIAAVQLNERRPAANPDARLARPFEASLYLVGAAALLVVAVLSRR